MKIGQSALIKKDIRSITANKRLLSVILIVPLVLTVVLPSVFVIGAIQDPDSVADFQVLLDMLPNSDADDSRRLIVSLLVNKIMPTFFLMIPIMATSVMAAASFVGEKEKHTLETLLYSPLSLRRVFQAKILSCFLVGMGVTFLSFAVMLSVVEAETLFFMGGGIMPEASWLIVMLLIAPAICLAAIALTVRGSAKAQSVEESQQRSVFLIFPIVALIIGQFNGILLLDSWILLGLGAALVVADVLLMHGASDRFTYENLLKN